MRFSRRQLEHVAEGGRVLIAVAGAAPLFVGALLMAEGAQQWVAFCERRRPLERTLVAMFARDR